MRRDYYQSRVGYKKLTGLQRLKILRSFASPYVRPSVRPSFCMSICLSVLLYVRLSVLKSVRLSVLMSVCQSVYQQLLSLSVSQSIWWFICLFRDSLSARLSVWSSIQSFFYLLLKRTAAYETDVLYSPKYTRDSIDIENRCFGTCSHLFCFALSLSVLIIML